MTKRNTSLPSVGRYRCWSVAIVAVALAGSISAVNAQSMLRFVDAGSDSNSTISLLPAPIVSPPTVAEQSRSEFRFLELTEGKTPPLPQFTITAAPAAARAESSQISSAESSSTLTFAPVQSNATSMTDEKQSAACELRFLLSPQQTPFAVSARQEEIAEANTDETTENEPVALDSRPAMPSATELFATLPRTQPSESKPRIVTALEHVPARVPQLADAQPVRSVREELPPFAPAGTELFASAAPVASTAPKKWDLPALDYGSALRQIEPAPVIVAAPKPIEPTRVVARELPASATEMFSLAPPQTLVAHSPIAPPQSVETLQVSKEPIRTERTIVAKSVPPALAAPAPAAAPTPVVARAPVAAPEPVIAAAPAPAMLFANEAPKLPAAKDLDFSRVPAPVEPAKPQFVSTAPTYVASAAPVSLPPAPERLVPATVAPPAVVKTPFAYESGNLSTPPAVASVTPAVAPERRQVTVTSEPSDPNEYTFHFAAGATQTPALLVNNQEPAAAGMPPAPMSPEPIAAPGGCNSGYCQYGCPYLPGQSGTRALCGVDCGRCGAPCSSTWNDAQCIPWALFGPGEYIGPARPAHVETYYLRVNDFITLTFIESRKKQAEHYRIGVGDELQIEWLQGAGNTETPLDRKLLVQPDGTVTLPLIGEVTAAGKTVNEFRDEAVKLYGKFQRDPQITVTPLTVNVAVQDVLKAVTSKSASSGQTQDVRVTPEGTIQAAGIGSVYVQGLTLDELRSELEARYAEAYGPGLAVSPQLTERATSYVFMGGEVRAPGRYTLEGPTTVMQAIAMAGGWNNGGNVRQVVVFRRDENWCLKATKIDVRAPLYGKDPCPTNDVWLRENDFVLVPKSCILCATDLIELYFTRGVYAVFPINYVYDFSSNSAIIPVP